MHTALTKGNEDHEEMKLERSRSLETTCTETDCRGEGGGGAADGEKESLWGTLQNYERVAHNRKGAGPVCYTNISLPVSVHCMKPNGDPRRAFSALMIGALLLVLGDL